jgi:hypothetical protein
MRDSANLAFLGELHRVKAATIAGRSPVPIEVKAI